MKTYTFTLKFYEEIPSRLNITKFFLIREINSLYSIGGFQRNLDQVEPHQIFSNWNHFGSCWHDDISFNEVIELLVELAPANNMDVIWMTEDDMVYIFDNVDEDELMTLRLVI